MTLRKDRVVKRATLASKIAGKKSRQRTFRRDLRGRFALSDSRPPVMGATPAISREGAKLFSRAKRANSATGKIVKASNIQKGRRLKR